VFAACERDSRNGIIVLFEDIQAFVNVARLGSFSRAAASVSIAQSALSKRVSRLERRVGSELMLRLPRGIELTETGRAFLKKAQGLVEEMEDMERNISAYVLTPTGRVRVTMPQRTCAQLSPSVLRRCQQELPLVNLELLEGTPGDVHSWISEGQADLALVYNGEFGADFDVKPLMVEPLYLIAPNAMTAQANAIETGEVCAIQDLGQLPLILPPRPSSLRVLVDRLCQGHGVRPNIVYEVAGTHTIRSLVASGMGVTIFSLSAWSYLTESMALRRVPFSSPLMSWRMFMVRRRGSGEAVAVNRVAAVLEQEFQRLLDDGSWPGARRIVEE
jgi:LysR family nitrogen assimilation transcriptional regulator